MVSKILVDFKHLNKGVFVRIDNKISKILIQRLKGKYKLWKYVGEKLNTSPSNIHRIKRTGVINLEMFKLIIKDFSIPFNKVRDKIYSIKFGCGGIEAPNILPLYPSPELSSLIAHSCGDGGIHFRSCRFEYTNSRKELIESVKKSIKSTFNFDEPYERHIQKTNTIVTKLIYPSSIGKLLKLAGAPRGKKTTQEFQIPEWVMRGSEDIKKAFLQALFDDEGSVEKRFLISLSLDKKYPYENNLLLFLNQVKRLLEEFEIDTVTIALRKKRDRVKGVLRITNLLRIEKFAEKINFTHIKRKQRLEQLLKTKRRVYKRGGESKEVILDVLKKSPCSTIEIARKIKRARNTTSRWLRILEKEKKVKRLFPTRHKTEVTWALIDYEGKYIPYHDAFHAIPLILEKGPKTTSELSRIFKLTRAHMRRYLRKFEKENIVKLIKRTRNDFLWAICDNKDT